MFLLLFLLACLTAYKWSLYTDDGDGFLVSQQTYIYFSQHCYLFASLLCYNSKKSSCCFSKRFCTLLICVVFNRLAVSELLPVELWRMWWDVCWLLFLYELFMLLFRLRDTTSVATNKSLSVWLEIILEKLKK